VGGCWQQNKKPCWWAGKEPLVMASTTLFDNKSLFFILLAHVRLTSVRTGLRPYNQVQPPWWLVDSEYREHHPRQKCH
jgi:hypothetical protein